MGQIRLRLILFNSGLPCDTIGDMSFDNFNNLWIGTGNGLAKYDGTNWIVYNNTNSPLTVKHISSIAIDKKNIKWIGNGNAEESGIISFDDTNLRSYTTQNSILPTGIIDDIFVDSDNAKWIEPVGVSGQAD